MGYFIQVTVYTVLLYGVYLLLLKNSVQHQWSRFFLLATALLPLSLPFIKLPALPAVLSQSGLASLALPAIDINTAASVHSRFDWPFLLIAVYALVALVLLFRFFIQYRYIHSFMKQGKTQRDGVYIIYNTGFGPGSWGRYIFLPEEEIDEAIYAHELAHVRLKHTIDLIVIRLVSCLLWPDFMLFVIIKELKIVHEFQADGHAADDRRNYTGILLNAAFDTNRFSLAHTFFHHPLKRRINMLSKKASSFPLRISSLAAAIALVATIIWVQSCTKDNKAQQYSSGLKVIAPTSAVANPDIYPTPSFDIEQFYISNLKYPGYAMQHHIEGRVIVKFVVDAQGNVSAPQILKSPDTSLSRATIDVLSKMPKWTPGQKGGKSVPVYFTLPVSFKLN